MLTLGSVVLAVINIGVMWAMAHRWRYAWHSNLALQLLWVPYDILTKQYGMLALSAIVAGVSLKACVLQSSMIKQDATTDSQPQLRRRGARTFNPDRFLAALADGETDARHAGRTTVRHAGRATVRHAGRATVRHAGRTDAKRTGLLSSARGRHAAGRLAAASTDAPFAFGGPQHTPRPARTEPSTLVRHQKEPIPG